MNPLTIEIHGTGTHNRGAELMAIAIGERMRATFPDVRIVVPPSFGDFDARARYGFHTTWEFSGRFRTRTYARFGPAAFRKAVGIVDPAEVDIVLDASGFAFSDQWGAAPVRELLAKMNDPRRSGQLLVLLPQALGPFEERTVREATKALLRRAALVCARDDASFEAVAVLCDRSKLRRYPDFTLAVHAVPSPADVPERFSAIVPNLRMLDKGARAEDYLKFLTHAVDTLERRGEHPCFVLHDAHEDRKVVMTLESRGLHIPVIEHPDPRVLKGILARASVVVASRFHALVSSLSQAVPCIGAGWSHKYPELFKDFGCPELLISELSDVARIDGLLEMLSVPDRREDAVSRIREASQRLRRETSEMWREIEALVPRRAAARHECG